MEWGKNPLLYWSAGSALPKVLSGDIFSLYDIYYLLNRYIYIIVVDSILIP
jgi:hypothetical protein